MAEMGKYCRAYMAKDFRKFPKWMEKLENLRKETEFRDGEEIEIERSTLEDTDILYLQEDYVVTDGIMKDEYVIFDEVSDGWKKYCDEELEFEIPVYEPIEIRPHEDAATSEDVAASEDAGS